MSGPLICNINNNKTKTLEHEREKIQKIFFIIEGRGWYEAHRNFMKLLNLKQYPKMLCLTTDDK